MYCARHLTSSREYQFVPLLVPNSMIAFPNNQTNLRMETVIENIFRIVLILISNKN